MLLWFLALECNFFLDWFLSYSDLKNAFLVNVQIYIDVNSVQIYWKIIRSLKSLEL